MSGSADGVPGTGKTPLTDAEARTRIETDTRETLFVDAGAGSGKTKSLVDRVRTLVLTDEIPLREIAAVTFTEKAGAELRDRLRVEFESAERDALVALLAEEGAAEVRAEWQRKRRLAEAALDHLDAAAIGTLHSFAQRILGEHPIEAKLPPLIEVLDEIASSVAFEERWAELRIALLDDASVRDPLLMAMASGVDLDHLRSLTRLLGNDWDLAVDRIVNAPPPPVPAVPDVTDLVAEAARVAALADQCWDDQDKLLPKLAEIGAWANGCSSLPIRRRRWPCSARRPGRRAAPDRRGTGRTSPRCGTPLRSLSGAPPRPRTRCWGCPCARSLIGWPAVSSRPRRSVAPKGGLSSTTCWSWLGSCCVVRRTGRPGTYGRCCPSGTGGFCSTSSRTPTRSRSSSPYGSPVVGRPVRSHGRTLPFRPGRCSSSVTRSSRSTGSVGPASGCT